MFSFAYMRDTPGFFSFRWQPKIAIEGFRDVAIVYKVPGRTDLSAIPDLIEQVCRGPFVPDAVVLVHLKQDTDFALAFKEGATANALVRFNGRLPLLRYEIPIQGGSPTVVTVRPEIGNSTKGLKKCLVDKFDEWVDVGLQKVFDPAKVIVNAPAGYAYQKPSQRKATYFIRAEQGLETSGAIAFVALGVWRYVTRVKNAIPQNLVNVFVDSMGVATVAYALRELFLLAKTGTPPQIESFHSYGGLVNVKPVPGCSLCMISASSSMNLHREWVAKKRVLETDVLTLVTFEDADDSNFALCRLPASQRPDSEEISAAYDIKIKGENFVPLSEHPRTVLLRKPVHGDERSVKIFQNLVGKEVFRLFRSQSKSNSRRRGIFCDGLALISTDAFNKYVDDSLVQHLRASTRYVVYQDDEASIKLAQKIVEVGEKITKLNLELVPVSQATAQIKKKTAGLIAVAAVCGGGAALLSLSRLLRGVQTGPRTFFIGLQVADSTEHIKTFDKNLKQSAHEAAIEIVRYGQIAVGKSVEDSFTQEISKLYSSSIVSLPAPLKSRVEKLRDGKKGAGDVALLPCGPQLKSTLSLRPDFAFWGSASYEQGPYHAELVGTIAVLLQRAREFDGLPTLHRLHSGALQHVTLDPENFARFDDGLIQAAILRAALPSELDYRGDKNASEYMKDFLIRAARHLGQDRSEAALEFLSAIAIGRLHLEAHHIVIIKKEFAGAAKHLGGDIEKAIRFFLRHIGGEKPPKKLVPF
jgi:hypothetical protein